MTTEETVESRSDLVSATLLAGVARETPCLEEGCALLRIAWEIPAISQ